MRILYLLIFICGSVYADKPVTLAEILKPVDIAADDERLYVAEKASVFIYSLKDFNLLKKFGRRGDGPGEFRVITGVFTGTDTLYVSGVNKLYFFYKDGRFIKMLKTAGFIPYFGIIGDKLLGYAYVMTDKEDYNTLSILDSNLRIEKEIYRWKGGKPEQGGMSLITREEVDFICCDNKIFVKEVNDIFHCFNADGKKIKSIEPEIGKIKVTDEDKKEYVNYYKNHPKRKIIYQMYKNRITFPEYFPAIRFFRVADKNLYVISYAKKDDKSGCQVLDLDGNLIKKVFLPIIFSDLIKTYPFTIKNGRLYQLVENIDEETWELHVTTI